MTSSAPKFEVTLLHGFLGLPSDWDFMPWQKIALGSQIRQIDLWPSALSAKSFLDWPRFQTTGDPAVLIGYSMGGRLAMHGLLDEPERYRAAILISAHPGLDVQEEKIKRRTSDRVWAERFRSQPWPDLMEEWNSQQVFQSPSALAQPKLERHETDFKREALARSLEIWSLAEQRDLSAELAKLKNPILYVSGEDDGKFTTLLSEVKKGPNHAHVAIPGAGHRVPSDNPEALAEVLAKWLRQLE